MPTALITGANRTDGIGFEIARCLGLKGYTVLIGSRDYQKGQIAADLIKFQHGARHAFPVQLDVTDLSSIQQTVQLLERNFGGTLDVLVHNGGIGISAAKRELASKALKENPIGFQRGKGMSTLEATGEDFKEVFSANVFGVVDLTNALAPLLAKSVAPRVVMVSSARGSLSTASNTDPARAGLIGYNASKAALNMVTVMFSKALPAINPAFKVNAASPGHTSTSFNNHTGARTVEAGAAVAVHLATLAEGGPNGGFYCDHAPFSVDGQFVSLPW